MYSPSMISLRSRSPSRGFWSIVSIMVLLTFSACSNVPPVEVRTVPVEVPRPEARPALPNPQPIETQPFKWTIITSTRLPEGDNWVYYAIEPNDYETLARNMSDILRWVKEAYWRLNYYRGESGLDGNIIPTGE